MRRPEPLLTDEDCERLDWWRVQEPRDVTALGGRWGFHRTSPSRIEPILRKGLGGRPTDLEAHEWPYLYCMLEGPAAALADILRKEGVSPAGAVESALKKFYRSWERVWFAFDPMIARAWGEAIIAIDLEAVGNWIASEAIEAYVYPDEEYGYGVFLERPIPATFLRHVEEEQAWKLKKNPKPPEFVEQEGKLVCGQCFSWAVNEQKERGGTLVHAIVTAPYSEPPQRYPHAWIERGGHVYDWQTMVAGHGGRWRGIGYPIETFYELYEPQSVRCYSREQAAVQLVRHRHYGPWELGINPAKIYEFPPSRRGPPTIEIAGRRYALSDMMTPLMEAIGEELAPREGMGARVIDLGEEEPERRFRYLWALDEDRKQLVSWRVSDGDEKFSGPSRDQGPTIHRLTERRQVNRVSAMELDAIQNEMMRRYEDTLAHLEATVEAQKSPAERRLDVVTKQLFDEEVGPELERRIAQIRAGAVPLGFKPYKVSAFPIARQMRGYVFGQVMEKLFDYETVYRYAREHMSPRDIDQLHPQAYDWARQAVIEKAAAQYMPDELE